MPTTPDVPNTDQAARILAAFQQEIDAIKPGSPTPLSVGGSVDRIISKSTRYIIYLFKVSGENLRVGYNTCFDRTKVLPHLNLYGALSAEMKKCVPINDRDEVVHQLATVLANVFFHYENPPPLSVFDHVKARICQYSEALAKTSYVSSAIIATAALLIFSLCERRMHWFFEERIYSYLVAACYGAIGALLSVLVRSNRIVVSNYTARSYYCFQGATRIVIGAIFGFAAFLALNAKVLFNFAEGNHELILLLIFVCGFKESIIPETLDRLGQNQASSENPGSRA